MGFPEPTHDTLRARLERLRNSRLGYCFRCGFPWSRVKAHITHFNRHEGCFPLCEECWILLGSPEARIEYYGMLIQHWNDEGPKVPEKMRLEIQKAVANGG